MTRRRRSARRSGTRLLSTRRYEYFGLGQSRDEDTSAEERRKVGQKPTLRKEWLFNDGRGTVDWNLLLTIQLTAPLAIATNEPLSPDEGMNNQPPRSDGDPDALKESSTRFHLILYRACRTPLKFRCVCVRVRPLSSHAPIDSLQRLPHTHKVCVGRQRPGASW